MTSVRSRRARVSLSVACVTALLFLSVTPAQLAGEIYHLQAAREHRLSQIQYLLAARDPGKGMVEELARGILRESEKNRLDPLLILAVIQVESRFDPQAVSSRGAHGLMQVRRIVVTELVDEGKISGSRHHDLKDPSVNIKVGASYLAYMIDMFGDVEVALAAYNWGPTRIRQKVEAREPVPSKYANKVLSVHRSLEIQLALNGKISTDGAEAG